MAVTLLITATVIVPPSCCWVGACTFGDELLAAGGRPLLEQATSNNASARITRAIEPDSGRVTRISLAKAERRASFSSSRSRVKSRQPGLTSVSTAPPQYRDDRRIVHHHEARVDPQPGERCFTARDLGPARHVDEVPF